MKGKNLKFYESPFIEELRVGQMYGICQGSPEPGSNEDISYEEWSL